METTFDFRISQPACVEALETYRRVETILEDEREKQKQNIQTLKPNWAGQSAETYAEKMEQFLNNGEYEHTYNKVKGMRQLLEEVLPEVNALLARCEGFADQLENDEYVEPIRPALGDNTTRNGGILSLNYAMINVIVNKCYEIEEENRVLTNTLISIVNDCEGLIENTENDMAAIEAASRKINRIANFRESFQKYAMGIRNLEYEMNLQLCRLAEDTYGLSQKVGISQTELESGEMDKTDIYNLSYMAEAELTALMEQCIEEDDIETMKCVAGQIFAKDSSRWSEAEALFIAQTLNHAFEKGDLGIIELYTGNMLTATYTEPKLIRAQTQYLPALYSSQYIVKPDVAKIELIMGNLNAKEQGLTYYTLNRMANMETESIPIESLSEEKADCGTFRMEAQKIFGEIQLIFHANIPDGYAPMFGDADREFTMTAYDMGEIITIEKAKALLELGCTETQIQELRECAFTDEDVAFIDKLSSREYSEMFDIRYGETSVQLQAGLTDYIMTLEKAGQTQELEKLINGVLDTDEQNNVFMGGDSRGQYLTVIKANLMADILEANEKILTVDSGSVEEKKIIDDAEAIYKQYGLWNAIDHVYYFDFGFDDLMGIQNQYAHGGYHAVISELGEGDGDVNSQYDFKVHFYYTETDDPDCESGTVALDGQYLYVNLEKMEEADFAEMEKRIKVDQLEQERKELAKQVVIDGINTAFEKAFPGCSYILPMVEAISEVENLNEFGNIIEAQNGFPYEEYIKYLAPYEETIGKKIAHDEINLLISAFFKEQELNAQIEHEQDQLWHLMYSQAVSLDIDLCDAQGVTQASHEFTSATGMLLPQAAKNLHKWETEGIAVYLREMGLDEDTIDDILIKLEKENIENSDWEKMLYGGNISEIEANDLSDLIKDMEGKLGDEYDISMWLKEGVKTDE